MSTKLNEYKITKIASTKHGVCTHIYLLLKNKYSSAMVHTSLSGNEYDDEIKAIVELKNEEYTSKTVKSIHNKATQKMIQYSIDMPTKDEGIYKYRAHKDAIKQYITFALGVSD